MGHCGKFPKTCCRLSMCGKVTVDRACAKKLVLDWACTWKDENVEWELYRYTVTKCCILLRTDATYAHTLVIESTHEYKKTRSMGHMIHGKLESYFQWPEYEHSLQSYLPLQGCQLTFCEHCIFNKESFLFVYITQYTIHHVQLVYIRVICFLKKCNNFN